jgi:hypothetical protein
VIGCRLTRGACPSLSATATSSHPSPLARPSPRPPLGSHGPPQPPWNGEGSIPLPFRRQSQTERDSALRGLPAPRAEPMEPHTTLGTSDTGQSPGSEATQIVLCMVYRPSGSIVRAFNRRAGRFQLHDLGLFVPSGIIAGFWQLRSLWQEP